MTEYEAKTQPHKNRAILAVENSLYICWENGPVDKANDLQWTCNCFYLKAYKIYYNIGPRLGQLHAWILLQSRDKTGWNTKSPHGQLARLG